MKNFSHKSGIGTYLCGIEYEREKQLTVDVAHIYKCIKYKIICAVAVGWKLFCIFDF